MGESIVNASLGGNGGIYSKFYVKRLPLSTGVSSASRTRNHRELQPIETVMDPMYPWMGWEHFIDSPPMDSSVDFCFYVSTERATPNSPVRSNVITCASTDIDVVAGPLSTNV